MHEINPDHPVASGLREQWHTVAAILIRRLQRATAIDEVVITQQEVDAFLQEHPAGSTIVANDTADGLHLRIVTEEEGQRIARQEALRMKLRRPKTS